MFVLLTYDISASLFAPARHPTPISLQPLAPSNYDKGNENLDDDDSGVETEQEWLDESHLTELSQRFPQASMSEAMIIEVCSVLEVFFLTQTLRFLFLIEAIVAELICGSFSKCGTWYFILSC